MRLFGHPVHTMLVHFPVALWPAHWVMHLLTDQLPPGTAGSTGHWLLVAGTGVGWIAAFCGLADLAELKSHSTREVENAAWRHTWINGVVLIGFTVLLLLEYASDRFAPAHGVLFLSAEGLLLGLMLVGNFWGGRVVWGQINGEHRPTD